MATGTDGKKLSKRLGSDPLACIPTEQALEAALRFLGQPCPAGRSLESLWDWALQHWDLSLVPHSSEIRFVGAADCDGQASD